MEQTTEYTSEFQKKVIASVELLWTAAQNNKGRGFNAEQINHIAGYLNSLSVGLMQHEQAKIGYENMIEAYTNKYGDELFRELTVIEGEVVNADEETDGSSSDAGLDAQEERDVEESVPEVVEG